MTELELLRELSRACANGDPKRIEAAVNEAVSWYRRYRDDEGASTTSFAQLLSHSGVLHALDTSGGVWFYEAANQRWQPLPDLRIHQREMRVVNHRQPT